MALVSHSRNSSSRAHKDAVALQRPLLVTGSDEDGKGEQNGQCTCRVCKTYDTDHSAKLASRLCSRWTTKRGIRELMDAPRLKLVLEMCIIAARSALAKPDHAAALLSHMEDFPV